MRLTTDVALDLFDHMEWADSLLWDAALKSDAARGDERLRRLMLHFHGVQRAFLDAWTNQPFAFKNTYDDTLIANELESVRSYYPRGRTFIEGLTAEQIAAPLAVPWSKWARKYIGRPAGPTTLGETVLQVLMHSMHHRAQANIRLRELDVMPPVVDYIAWLWLERPKPAWPATVGT